MEGGGGAKIMYVSPFWQRISIKFDLLFSIISIFRVTPHCFVIVLSVSFCYFNNFLSQIFTCIHIPPHPLPRCCFVTIRHWINWKSYFHYMKSLLKCHFIMTFYNYQNLNTNFSMEYYWMIIDLNCVMYTHESIKSPIR